jgi:colanic acid/amylovoran biosynthesis glycosyltransferase
LGCSEDKIFKLPVGFQISQYSFCDRKLNPGEAVKIITVARLVEKKGIEYAIKAIAEIAKDYPNIIYRIVGDGSLRESLEALVLDLKISDNVKLLGWMTQEQVRQLYDDSHIFILPSVTAADGDREGQALVLQEAQAMGLPILSTLHNGIPEGVLDGKSGFLVPERDVDALAEKLRYLVTNPEGWATMGRQGRAYVEERYNIEQLNEQLVELYQKLMN